MPSPKKTRKDRIIRFVNIAASLLILGFFVYLQSGAGKPEPEWPYSAVNVAKSVPLSELRATISDEGNGRRIAIVNDKIYVEMEKAAGDAAYTKENLDDEGRTDKILTSDLPFPNGFFISEFFFNQDLLNSSYEVEFFEAQEGISAEKAFAILFQVLFLGLMVYLLMSMTGKSFKGGSFGTEKGFDLIKVKDLTTDLKDVAGLDNARTEVEEVIALLKDDGAAGMAGGRLPRGLLLDGPPGTGKTLIARAMAKEAGVGFIKVDASSLSQMFVGLGAMKVRKMFRLARKNAPCIIFIDEIDAVGGARGNGGGGGGEQEKDNTLNALLTELDGFEARSGVFVIAATNRPEILDRALMRPGRIDRRITLQLPDIRARREILEVHSRNKQLGEDVDLKAIAATAYQMSGAQLENLVNEAALMAGRRGREVIAMEDFTEARDRMLMPQSGGTVGMMEDERRITAVHEAGHAVVAILSAHADPVEKVTIAPRGGALGFVLQAADRDRVFESKGRLHARLVVAAAGREAERLVFGDDMITTGAASDIRQATAVARAMVTTYGMSEMGFMAIDPQDSMLFDMQNPPSRIISKMIEESAAKCAALLSENREALDRLTEALLDQETLTGEETRRIVLNAA